MACTTRPEVVDRPGPHEPRDRVVEEQDADAHDRDARERHGRRQLARRRRRDVVRVGRDLLADVREVLGEDAVDAVLDLDRLLGALAVLAAEPEREAREDDRRELHVVGPEVLRDREVLVAADVRLEVLLLEELLLPLGAVVPAGVEEDLVREDDERVARLLVQGVEARVSAGGARLLVEDLLEIRGDGGGLEPHAAADLLAERAQEEEEAGADPEEVRRRRAIHGSRSPASRRRRGRT